MQSNTPINQARECLQLMQGICHQLDSEKTACRMVCDSAHAARQHIKALTDLIGKKDTVAPLAAEDWIISAASHLQVIINQVRQNRITIDPTAWSSVLLVKLNLPLIARDLR